MEDEFRKLKKQKILHESWSNSTTGEPLIFIDQTFNVDCNCDQK